MCGITGIYSPCGGVDGQVVRSMTGTLAHRGPDGSGTWIDDKGIVAFGHSRLSILDLSSLGHQPMHSACGRYTISYNGEIYNHLELRKELFGYKFKSMSDTETILAAIAEWGLENALNRFVGMFAFALWDSREKNLFIVRDRLGIKPLFYGKIASGWVFGSELKALKAHPQFLSQIDRSALTLYFRHNYIPAPHCIYSDTWKLEPGQMAVFSDSGMSLHKWWDVRDVWQAGHDNLFTFDEAEAIEQLESVLSEAVSARMLSDVPLGAFLSGGIDSSTIVALMQKASSSPVRTFSIGFDEAGFNEAEHAKNVAWHLGTDHTELYVSSSDLLNVVPSIPKIWDEPFSDSSQIPTYILSQLTKEHVTVSLSGDGGDELFSGYDRYFWTDRVYKYLSAIPGPMRSTAVAIGRRLPKSFYNLLGGMGQKIRWRIDALQSDDFESLYRYFISHFKNPASFVIGGEDSASFLGRDEMGDKWAWMSLFDLVGYLPEDILTKVDRASMAVGLEARVPLIDHRVVEFASRVPTSMKVRNGQGKWLLKQVLNRHVPKELVDRPKMGFGVPIQRWMREGLREWCSDLLSPGVIRQQGYIDADLVEQMWGEYLNGETNWNYYLWDVLMFQSWLEDA